MVWLSVTAWANGELRLGGVKNLAREATIEASCAAGVVGAKYGIDSANDGNIGTWWASCDFPTFPVIITLTFKESQMIDTVAFVQASQPMIYTNWKTLRIEFSDGSVHEEDLPDSAAPFIVRFEQRRAEWLRLVILEPHDRGKHYVTLSEVVVCSDPEQKVMLKMPPTEAWKHPDITPQGREAHPCVYITKADIARARQKLQTEEWAQKWFESIRVRADEWVDRDDAWIASIVPAKGACFAYGFTGCPICGASWGQWGSARCNFNNPQHVMCTNGHLLPDETHPDKGTGYVGPDGRIHYFIGSYNAWVVETLQFQALQPLAYTYTLTGDQKYAAKAAHILDLLADIYPSCDKGSWDYPSNPPSGRFCRPWYQVARVLIHYTDWYDQIYDSPALDQPSVREGMTRRQNIESNLLQNGAWYCYEQSLKGRLHNGEADYIRGALAVGCCLGIPWYVDWAYDGPYGILNLVCNNVDRDGRYFETSTMYADHTRELYLTFAEPLLNYRSAKYPHGINLYNDRHFQRFYVLPQLGMNCLGKSPRFGDSGPDCERSYLPNPLTSAFDYKLAERLYARVTDEEAKARFEALLQFLTGGNIGASRAAGAEMPWLLFHGVDPPTDPVRPLDPQLHRRISQSDFFGQKGIGILRAGTGPTAQAVLIRYGPTLNHGHLDDLNLNYYALGYELTYDLGYGLGSTHTQVGWARQTASHNLVLVNETSQGTGGSGTGGSLHQFADLPGLKLMEVSSENSYREQGVTTYRRLVALVEEGPESYLVDIFRVAGGEQHDYLLHSFGERADFEGVRLGAPEPGSLAGPKVRWGELQLNDGDMAGYPGKPYWNPPPGNGLGFLMEPQRGQTADNWSVSWPLPEEDAAFRLTMLGQPQTEVITAWAPGIYPHLPKARYVIGRRQGHNLKSTFIGLLEPHGRRLPGQQIDATVIGKTAQVSAGEVKYLAAYDILLHQAKAAGDELRWSFDVQSEDNYIIILDHFCSPSYGEVQLILDGEPLGEPVRGTDQLVHPGPAARLGKRHLTAGKHQAALRMTNDDGAGHYWFGIRALWLLPEGTVESTTPEPFIERAERLECTREEDVSPAGVVVFLKGERRDVLLSAANAQAARVFMGEGLSARLEGAFAHVRMEAEAPRELHLVAAKNLTFDEYEVSCATAEYAGTVTEVDERNAVVETAVRLPTDGRLNGQLILFENPLYSRNTAHRIDHVELAANGSRIVLESPSLILGTGILEDDPQSDTEFVSLLAHEYARSDSTTGTQFFSGKFIKGEGFATRILRTAFEQLMRYEVESTEGMTTGDEFVICDVQRGDDFRIPTLAYLRWEDEGRIVGGGTTHVTVRRATQTVAEIEPTLPKDVPR
ncbi:MAG: heparinase II/III domain-containing protein [Candidatus Zipacnadales bacterium]